MMNFQAIKNRQWYLLIGMCLFVLGCGMGYLWVSHTGPKTRTQPEFKNTLTTGTSRINPQEAWVYKFNSEAELNKKRMDTMEDILTKLVKLNEASKNSIPEAPTIVERVREELKTHQDVNTLPPPPGSFETANTSTVAPAPAFRSKAIQRISLTLKNPKNKFLKTVDNTIPAGAFAHAVLLGGVDASASIQASSDPRPALLRLTDAGTLPRKFRSDLKGCHVLAACYADISSERVMMRLEKLTCTERKTGEIIEVKVQGYVAGEDGRTGVRGSVVDRAGESMRNAMVGGFIGGMGEFLSQARNPVTFSPVAGLAQANPMGVSDALKHGAGKGTSNALDKYAEFYIKRAEQVQPVIQIASGRQLNVVFTEGVSIGDTAYREAKSQANDQVRYQQIQEH